ncbi:mandelate racemase [Ktedonobacter sp. SOSP1-52]|uniref:enolase C-terminal domain-like protein n=1 Tax=Ktedonobacter sp. SOSP1-52 TaxID=2778366 RepID=UPI00191681A0|nr:enolase C-terminal domain-like protein [Ktedonobacter sp. SOSP1-52]GHO70908.1 mandelate racemase [Ktedonobacter sp. SOSP1-52]
MVSTKFGDNGVAIEHIDVSAYKVSTDSPESDGTYSWDATTIVLVEVQAGDKRGLGYTYADVSTATLVKTMLAQVVQGENALNVPACWKAMVEAVRNLGRPGIASMAIAAVDVALWDLKARLLDLPLVSLLGAVREAAPIYGSGGFTSYSREQLQRQLGDWVQAGIPRVKMKIGTHPDADPQRVREAREAIGPDSELFVDANGAYSRKQALALAQTFAAESGVTWFEEPVSSDDLEGLRLVRDRAPAGMAIAAGEYGYDLWYFNRMLEAGAVDVLQADATRCGGITGFLRVGALVEARSMQLSAHCGPTLHIHPCCALNNFRHMEYFYDHVRIEHMFFAGVPTPIQGALHPDLSRPGLGLELKRSDITKYVL